MKNIFIISSVCISKKSGAAYSRYMHYARALTSKENVKVFFCTISHWYNFFSEPRLLDKNIYLLSDIVPKNENKYKRQVVRVFSIFIYWNYYLNFLKQIKKIQGEQRFYLVPGTFCMSIITYIFIKIRMRKKLFSEKNELKTAMFLNIFFTRGLKINPLLIILSPFLLLPHLLNDLLVFFSDGVIVISSRMEKFVRRFNKNTIRIPILCDVKKYRRIPYSISNKEFNIGFTGTLDNRKEGIFSFIQAIEPIAEQFSICLNLYGPITKKDKQVLDMLRRKSSLQIRFKGNIEIGLIPEVLIKQNLLVLPRPANLQTNYGFSTKLAEYLASGVPVFISDVSDNELFVNANHDGFIFKNSEEGSILAGMQYILNHQNVLEQIAENGILVAEQYFDFRNYTETIYKFIA